MKITFYKYHGTGNDFILVDDRKMHFPEKNERLIQDLCHRHYGIGADGLIIIRNSKEADFEMLYYNSDGRTASLCGNGSRCAIAFTEKLGIINKSAKFIAFDGLHHADIINDLITIKMHNVSKIEIQNDAFILDTGSPHYVLFDTDIQSINVTEIGKNIRYNNIYKDNGINVNFVEIKDNNKIKVRTYERGVENETLSCGTGVVASAIAASLKSGYSEGAVNYQVYTNGGSLNVDFIIDKNVFKNVKLSGNVVEVFKGEIELNL